ncbi:MAG: hypothetical protein ACK55Z_35090, partial [bacterium]
EEIDKLNDKSLNKKFENSLISFERLKLNSLNKLGNTVLIRLNFKAFVESLICLQFTVSLIFI